MRTRSFVLAGVVAAVLLSLTSHAGEEERGCARVFYNRPPDANGLDRAFLDQIEGARTSIDASFYSITKKVYSDALIAAKERGVRVRVVTETERYDNPDLNQPYKDMERAGIRIVPDGRASIMHHKFMVIDGRKVLTGAANMSGNAVAKDLGDTFLFESRGMARAYTLEFEEQFVRGRFGTRKQSRGNYSFTIRRKEVEVFFGPQAGTAEPLLEAIGDARHSVEFLMFTFTDKDFAEAMTARRKAGATVRGVLDWKQAASRREMIRAGVKEEDAATGAGYALYRRMIDKNDLNLDVRRDKYDGLLHHKMILIDRGHRGAKVVVGSFNLTAAANNSNDENTVIIHDPAVVDALGARFDEVWEECE